MTSTAEEVKAEMFGEDPSAGHHEVMGRYSPGRTETGSAVAETPIADDVVKLVGQLVDLAEARLRASRRLLSRRSAIHDASNIGQKAGGQGNVTTPAQPHY
jgi:hypothetical protein